MALTTQLGSALQQSLGKNASQQASDIAGVNTQLGTLGINRVNAINDLSNTLQTQDYQQKQYQQSLALAQQKAAASTTTVDPFKGYTTKAKVDANGNPNGTNFFGPGNTPITAAQFYQNTGQGLAGLASFLQNDSRSKAAYTDLTSGRYTPEELTKKYPYIFGGI